MNRVMAFLRKAHTVLPVEKMAPVPVVNVGGGRRKTPYKRTKPKTRVFSVKKWWLKTKQKRKTAKASRRTNRRRK